ncbi:MAG: hypothetical protein EBT12_03175, partial [Marivivens sp.]|nr:hypothetical protein [Marivivens sp.]
MDNRDYVGQYLDRSWATEELNTLTRGANADIPAWAYVVATTRSVTVYDLTTIDAYGKPKMWMVFNMNQTGGGGWSTSQALPLLTELMTCIDKTGTLVNVSVNDAETTILSGAPLDNYGRSTETILVACGSGTSGGVSIIQDSGTVVSASSIVYPLVAQHISYLENNRALIVWSENSATSGNQVSIINDITAGTLAFSHYASRWYGTFPAISSVTGASRGVYDGTKNRTPIDGGFASYRDGTGLAVVNEDITDITNGMVANVSTEMPPSWEAGDSRLSTIRMTRDTELPLGDNLVTNGSGETGDLTNWQTAP